MAKFNLYTAGNTSQRALIELRDHRIAFPGVACDEPLLRGCNQRDWLEQLASLGIRHLIVPLNGAHEDACLFARRHPAEPASASSSMQPVLYDLEHRDEGVFVRLQFLIEAAEQIGILVGLSLFDATSQSGPLRREANEQAVALEDMLTVRARTRKGTTVIRARNLKREKVLGAMNAAVDWVGPVLRGHRGVWASIFRGKLLGAPDGALESDLIRRMAGQLRRADDAQDKPAGPWIVAPPQSSLHAEIGSQCAPFVLTDAPISHSSAGYDTAPEQRTGEDRRPAVCWLAARRDLTAVRGTHRSILWQTVMQGAWPVVSFRRRELEEERGWKDLAQVATFGRHWLSHGYVRPCPEVLQHMAAARADGKVFAATDGSGRYFAFFRSSVRKGLRLMVLPGTYRYYWFDVATGRGLDYGDGIEGGRDCQVPHPRSTRQTMLILEQEELTDALTSW
ncbi:MAG TPA: hypothetical protein VGP72_30765 [Planctomycetota bacterium]